MALFRKKKQKEGGGSQGPAMPEAPAQESTHGFGPQSSAPSESRGEYRPAPQATPLEPGLERRWEQAWQRARSGRG